LSLELEPGNAASRRRIETRLLHYEQLAGTEEVGDQFWRGYSYRWNDDQTDAELVESAGADRTFKIADRSASGGQRSQSWHFPSRAECTVCHNMAARYVLGMTTNQVNREHDYGAVVDNQLRTFDHLGLFTKPLPKPPAEMVRLVDYSSTSADLNQRARAYLHANCSHCHRKWGGGNTEFQLLASLELPELGIVGTKPAHGGFFIADAQILAPGDPLRSTILYRAAKLGPGRMPRIGSEVVDDFGVQLLHDWIASLPQSRDPASGGISAEASAATALVALTEHASPSLEEQQRLIDQLLATTRGAISAMLTIDRGKFRAEIRQAVVARGTASADSHVRDLFEKYLPEEQRPKRLGSVIQPSAILALSGDQDRGRQLFFNTAGVQCRNCHQIQQQGTAVGPDLSQVGKKYDRAKLLENILSPSREIDPKFVVHMAETKDGRLHSGLLVERTEQAVVLKDAKNQIIRLAANEIEQLTSQQQSLMPDLLLRDLTAQQVADLIAFLSALR
jgi:putative heme-binding domain-containing protein